MRGRVLDWKERFIYTESVSHTVHALFGPDNHERVMMERTGKEALYAELGQVCRVRHWNQLQGLGTKRLRDQLRIRRYGDGNRSVHLGAKLKGGALVEYVKKVVQQENPWLAETAGDALKVVGVGALKKDLEANPNVLEQARFPNVEPMHEGDRSKFVHRVHIPTMQRKAHPKKQAIATWLLAESSDPNSVHGLNAIATFLLQHETATGEVNPHRLALREFSEGTAPLCAWWETYQALVRMGAKHLPGDAEECEGLFSGVSNELGAKKMNMTSHSVSADLRSRRNPMCLQAEFRLWDDAEVRRRFKEARQLVKVLEGANFWSYDVVGATLRKALMSERWKATTHRLVDSTNSRRSFQVQAVHEPSEDSEIPKFELKASTHAQDGPKTLVQWASILGSGPLKEVRHISVEERMATFKEANGKSHVLPLQVIEEDGDPNAWHDLDEDVEVDEDVVEDCVEHGDQGEQEAVRQEVAELMADRSDEVQVAREVPNPLQVNDEGEVLSVDGDEETPSSSDSEEEDLLVHSSSSSSSSESTVDVDDEEVDLNEVCATCLDGGELIGCDHCDRWYHLDCIDEKLRPKVASGEFICVECDKGTKAFDAWLAKKKWLHHATWMSCKDLQQEGIEVDCFVLSVTYPSEANEDVWLSQVVSVCEDSIRLKWFPWSEQASALVEGRTKYHSTHQPNRRAVTQHAFVEEGGSIWVEPRRAWRCLQLVQPIQYHFQSCPTCWGVTMNDFDAYVKDVVALPHTNKRQRL